MTRSGFAKKVNANVVQNDARKAHAAAAISELTTDTTMLFSRWAHQLEKVAEGCDDASL